MIKIREQTDSDTDAVKSIIAIATDELRSVYRPVKTKVQNKDKDKKTIGIVATIKENIVGTAELLYCKDNIFIQGLAVSPAHRRQGVARAIIEYVFLKAQKEGKNELTLSTIKETGNANAFLHMGFTIESEEISTTFESAQSEQVTLVSLRKKV